MAISFQESNLLAIVGSLYSERVTCVTLNKLTVSTNMLRLENLSDNADISTCPVPEELNSKYRGND
jgi:hypothetical protein